MQTKIFDPKTVCVTLEFSLDDAIALNEDTLLDRVENEFKSYGYDITIFKIKSTPLSIDDGKVTYQFIPTDFEQPA